jgi:hypothetical protein
MTHRPDNKVLETALFQLREVYQKHPEAQTEELVALGKWIVAGAPGQDITEERFELKQKLLRGESVRCPCCDQNAKVYRRTIHAGMAAQLIRIYKAGLNAPDGWVSVDEIYSHGASGDYAKLRFWGLVESKDKRGPDDNASGYWRVTPRGDDFVNERISVPAHVLVYNNEKLGVDSAETIRIRDALGTQFSYQQLMG